MDGAGGDEGGDEGRRGSWLRGWRRYENGFPIFIGGFLVLRHPVRPPPFYGVAPRTSTCTPPPLKRYHGISILIDIFFVKSYMTCTSCRNPINETFLMVIIHV